MMKKSKPIIVNSYVQLKEGFDNLDLYRGVDAGATGWVRDKKTDFDGFEMLFIEWDQTNPVYAGEADKWVFESHFEMLSRKVDVGEFYVDSIRAATDTALAADGYFMLALVRKPDPITGIEMYIPVVHAAQLEKEVLFMLEAHIIDTASAIFENHVRYNIQKREDDDEPRR